MINGKGRFDACVEDPTLLQCDKNGCSVQDYVPAISVEQGKTYLFRVINAGGLVSLNLALANHTMRIMKTDGRFVNPIDVTSLELNLAQRYSVLVKADQAPESYWVAAHSERSGSGYAYLQYLNSTPPDANSTIPVHDMRGIELDGLLVSKDVSTHPQADLLDTGVTPDRSSVIVAAQSVYPPLGRDFWTSNNVSLSMYSPKPLAAVAYEAVNDDMAAPWPDTVIPGTVLVPDMPDAVWNYSLKPSDAEVSDIHMDHGLAVFQFVLGNVVDMVFQNTVGNRGAASSHSWHLHGHEVYVLAQGSGTFAEADKETFNFNNPLLRDTFSVWDFGWTAVRFKANVSDSLYCLFTALLKYSQYSSFQNAGVWPFHCTVAPHVINGMGFNVITSPDLLSTPPPGLMSCTMTSVNPDDAQVCMSKAEYEEVIAGGDVVEETTEISLLVGDDDPTVVGESEEEMGGEQVDTTEEVASTATTNMGHSCAALFGVGGFMMFDIFV